jgi:hypothetical protein
VAGVGEGEERGRKGAGSAEAMRGAEISAAATTAAPGEARETEDGAMNGSS